MSSYQVSSHLETHDLYSNYSSNYSSSSDQVSSHLETRDLALALETLRVGEHSAAKQLEGGLFIIN